VFGGVLNVNQTTLFAVESVITARTGKSTHN